ncbi:head-tail joining protein [Escherichia phage fBC-Eco01]|nr:head-tail joining protein [Escherichia phage fBC-Eco01]
MADNYVIREKYTHVDIVDGQVMPVRGVVEADELVATQPDNEEAHNNGGGTKRRRRKSEG